MRTSRVGLVITLLAVCCERIRRAAPDYDHPEQSRATYNRTTNCVLSQGVVACKGDNSRGMVGGGDRRAAVSEFRRVELPARIVDVQITPTSNAACALGVDGGLWCWGINLGLLGTAVPLFRGAEPEKSIAGPIRIGGGVAFKSIALWAFHACALDRDGAAYCWGDNRAGQVVDPHVVAAPVVLVPRRIELPAPVAELHLQDVQSCALLESRELYCWGGAFADAAGVRPLFGPTRVGTDVTSVRIDVANEKTCIQSSGGAFCWAVRDSATERAIEQLLPADR